MKIAVYVQHLLGTGHLVRAQLLAQALGIAGHDVILISGGKASEGEHYSLLQLPVAKTVAGNFTELLDQSGNPVDQNWKSWRAGRLLDAMTRFAPDILVIETWPFGRRQMEFEILPLVDLVTRCPEPAMVVCSIRDVLQIRKRSRRLQTLEQLKRYFSLVLVHGDQELIPLKSTFPEQSQIACPVAYTGYIHSNFEADSSSREGAGETLVSAGGGAAGERLLQIAAEASQQDHRTWRLLAGPGVSDGVFNSLVQLKGRNLEVERNRADFRQLLNNCGVSVSQFGYNTALDIVTAGCTAVVVPYAQGGETEQKMRAEKFSHLGYCITLDEELLSAKSLISAVNTASVSKPVADYKIECDGANRSQTVIKQYFERFRT